MSTNVNNLFIIKNILINNYVNTKEDKTKLSVPVTLVPDMA